MDATVIIAEIEKLITLKVKEAVASLEANQNNCKRMWEEICRENPNHQPIKEGKANSAATVGLNVKKNYKGKKPHCNKCNRHHKGPCGKPCRKCLMYGHQTKDCRSKTPETEAKTPKACHVCGSTEHLRKDCPKWNNKDNNQQAKRNTETNE